jgi:hypothetical protein
MYDLRVNCKSFPFIAYGNLDFIGKKTPQIKNRLLKKTKSMENWVYFNLCAFSFITLFLYFWLIRYHYANLFGALKTFNQIHHGKVQMIWSSLNYIHILWVPYKWIQSTNIHYKLHLHFTNSHILWCWKCHKAI